MYMIIIRHAIYYVYTMSCIEHAWTLKAGAHYFLLKLVWFGLSIVASLLSKLQVKGSYPLTLFMH